MSSYVLMMRIGSCFIFVLTDVMISGNLETQIVEVVSVVLLASSCGLNRTMIRTGQVRIEIDREYEKEKKYLKKERNQR